MVNIDANDERLILNSLNDGAIVLVLGAGASATCTKLNGEKVRQGRALADLLANKAGLPYAGEELPDVIAGVIGQRISGDQFHQILRNEYTKINPSRELSALFNYTWRRIYTWNVDDSLESVQSSVQRRRYFNGLSDKVSVHEGHDYVQIIHLHGDASKPEHGFIFSQSEYNARLNKGDHDWYRALTSDYISYTPVFIGSRLNEPILSAELDRARPVSGAGLGVAYLVTPDQFTEVQLSGFKARNIVVISATLDQFVSWINEKVGKAIYPKDVARRANEFVERLVSTVSTNSADIEAAESIFIHTWRATKLEADALGSTELRQLGRAFLEGAPPTWRLAATAIPVWLQRTESLYRAMTESFRNHDRCFIAYGQAGSGKTMALMQCLLRYSRENEGVILYELKSDVRSLRASLGIIMRLHKDSHVIIYVRDVFLFGDALREDILSINPGQITLISSARSGEWREHIERRIGDIAKSFLYQRFVEGDYSALIERLVEYVPAPAFLKMPLENKIKKIRSSQSQLLIALKETTESDIFIDVITNEFLNLPDDDCRMLLIIVGISTIARSGIRESEARAAYDRLGAKRQFSAALIALEGIVSKDSLDRLWARHELYVRHLVENVVEFEDVISAIVEILRTFTKYKIPIVKTVGRLDAVLFKFLLNHNFNADLARRRHGKEEGRRIYETFEVEFQLDGHFWLQYGQYLVAIGEDEEALSVLSKSIQAYSENSYAVHAFADLQLRVAIKRKNYDATTVKLIGDAVKALEEQHRQSLWDSDQYPIVTLAEKHVAAMIVHKQISAAKAAASKYFRELEIMSRQNSVQPLQRARERLAHYLATGIWHEGEVPDFSDRSKRMSRRRGRRRK
ncbi:P-loop NTPase [Azospirillum argentinense]